MLIRLQVIRQSTRLCGSTTFRFYGDQTTNVWKSTQIIPPPSKMESFTLRYLSLKDQHCTRKHICTDEILDCFDVDFTPKMLKSILLSTSNGIRFSLLIREDLLAIKRVTKEFILLEKLRILDAVLVEHLGSVFSRNILSHQRITFENSSGIVLEKLAEAEAVHKIRALSEMKKRLSARGRRCFALFHPCLDNDPLTFVHVSLSRDITTNMRDIYKNEENLRPTCAIYYSINSPYAALGGLNIAESLLKRTTAALSLLHPTIQTHSTLSPIPGFMKWLSKLHSIPKNVSSTGGGKEVSECIVNIPSHLLDDICTAIQSLPQCDITSTMPEKEVLSLLYCTLQADEWHTNAQFCNLIKQPLLWLCHYYLLEAKVSTQIHPRSSQHKTPLDPVARFHLRNGAILHQINWLANMDAAGLRSSAGMMVNYRYDLSRFEDLKQDFQTTLGVIPFGESVLHFLKNTVTVQ